MATKRKKQTGSVTLMDGPDGGPHINRMVTATISGGDLEVWVVDSGERVDEFLRATGAPSSRDTYEFGYLVPAKKLDSFLATIGVDPAEPLTGLRSAWSTSDRVAELLRRLEEAADTHDVEFDVL